MCPLVAAALAAAPPAAAAAPVAMTSFDRTTALGCPQGFTLVERYEGIERTRLFDDGTQHTHVRVTATFTNATSGASLTPFLITARPGKTVSFVGATFRVVVPGEDAVAVDAGRLVFDWSGDVIFDQGPSDAAPNLCALLTG